MSEFSLNTLEQLISSNDVERLQIYMEEHNLHVDDNNKIVPKDKKEYDQKVGFWDKRQYVRKILLNS